VPNLEITEKVLGRTDMTSPIVFELTVSPRTGGIIPLDPPTIMKLK